MFDALIGQQFPEAYAITRPSFQPEHAILIRGTSRGGVPEHITSYELQLVVARKFIWHYGHESERGYVVPARYLAVDRISVPIAVDDAKAIINTWFRALRDVKYIDTDSKGLDGTATDFFSRRRWGSTWSPDSGNPAAMVHETECLTRYVRAQEIDRPDILVECLKINAAVETP